MGEDGLAGSRHRWFQDDRWYDLIEVLDDATSETYYAQLVEEESRRTVEEGNRFLRESYISEMNRKSRVPADAFVSVERTGHNMICIPSPVGNGQPKDC